MHIYCRILSTSMADFSSHRFKMHQNDETIGEEGLYNVNLTGELKEWADVNRQLRKQGFQAVRVRPASDVPVSAGGYVSLDPDSNDILRHNLLSLLAENDHRQTLVHDLMEANRRLKDDIAGLTDKSDKLQSKSKDLKIMLECSRKRVQELEREMDTSSLRTVDDNEKGRNLRNAIHKRCKQLEEAFAEKEIELDKLHKKMRVHAEEEEKRLKRQNQIFCDFKKRTARAHSLTDSKLLDIIDMYEKQLCDLKEEVELTKLKGKVYSFRTRRGESRLQGQDDSPSFVSSALDPTKNAKSIIKSLERQLQDADRRTKALHDEKELMSLEMSARPQLTDYRLAAQRVKKLERLLTLHNISVPGEKAVRDPFRAKRSYSTKLEDLDYLPVDLCQTYLKELCSELGVDDMEKLLPEIHDLSKRLEQAGIYQELCLDMQQLVDRMQDPSRASRHRHHSSGSVSEESVKHSLQIIENWRKDMSQLQEFQESLNHLLAHLVPRSRIHFTSAHTVSDMAEIIENLADEETTAVTKEGYEHISRSTLEGIVQHFQMLFDIPSVSGVLTRMNDIYKRYGEAVNVIKTLRQLLGLADDSNSASVVDAVGRLCQAHNSTTSRQLQQLFETDDLGSVIRRLDEHTNFFPAFKDIMCKLLEILGVERMDQVVPAVRALKLLST